MNHLRAYKLAVIGSAVFNAIGFFLPYADTALYSEQAVELLRSGGYKKIISLPTNVSLLMFFAWIALARGMWVFSNRARSCYLGMTVFCLLLTPLEGFRVESPIDAALIELVLMLDGVVVALAYFSPVKDEFSDSPAA